MKFNKLKTYKGYTSNAVEEQKQCVPVQIFHLGGQRKEKHNNHIMVGSIINSRAAIFFTKTRHKGGNSVNGGVIWIQPHGRTGPHLLTVPRIVGTENQIGCRATVRKIVLF